MSRIYRIGLLILLLGGGLWPPPLWAQSGNEAAGRIAPALQATLAALPATAQVTVVVRLQGQPALPKMAALRREERLPQVVKGLQARAEASQRGVRAWLDKRQASGQVREVIPLWIANALAVTATPDVIRDLAARPDVLRITPNEQFHAPTARAAESSAEMAIEPNLAAIHAPALWALGILGQGVVVASMDTGVELSHPDLVAQWRGGANSWYDPNREHSNTPTDVDGHGTWTMGVILGRSPDGTRTGVAPAAQWIAVKIFNDAGVATTVGIHQGFQWLLDPDGNPDTPDAPHVVNNSWSFEFPGCNTEYLADVQALEAAGIVPLFAAGNTGPASNSSVSPANYPEAFSVGAVDSNNALYLYSSRGPCFCGGSKVYPDLVAPGVLVRTTDRFQLYYRASGTSLAAPHAAGALALLLSAQPGLTVTQQREALRRSALDLGASGPDDLYGYGYLDVLGAYRWLSSVPQSPPSFSTYLPAVH